MTATAAQVYRTRSRNLWVAAIALLALALWVYWPGLSGGFIFDDMPNLVENPALRVTTLDWRDWVVATFSTPSGPLQRPLSMFSFALNHYFTGLDPWPMKLTNLSIHLLNGALVFALARQLLRASAPGLDRRHLNWAALFAASLWCLHPINLMAVLYVVQRMESLCHVFVFAGLLMYAVGRCRQLEGRPGWALVLFGLVGCTAAGVLAKESAVLLPIYAFCLELCLFHFRIAGRGGDRSLRALFAVVLFLPGALGIAKYLPKALAKGAMSARNFNLGERLLTESRVVLDYLHWTLVPDLGQLSLFHDDYVVSKGLLSPPSTLLALIAIPLLLVAAWRLRAQRPLASLGIFWFLAAQVLTATIIPLELVFEHRNYFASFGICLVLTDFLLVKPIANKRTATTAIALGLLAMFTVVTHLRALEWSSPLRFAMSEAAKHPRSPRATYNLAGQLIDLTQYRADSPYVGRTWAALDAARQAPGSGLLPLQASLMFAARTGAPMPDRWWDEFRDRLRAQPLNTENRVSLIALSNCAVEEVCDFPREQMLSLFEVALAKGTDAGVLSIYGKYALYVLKDVPLATRLWRDSAAQGPRNPQFHINLAMLSTGLGNFAEARREIALLRNLGILGQYHKQADELEVELRAAELRSLQQSTGRAQ